MVLFCHSVQHCPLFDKAAEDNILYTNLKFNRLISPTQKNFIRNILYSETEEPVRRTGAKIKDKLSVVKQVFFQNAVVQQLRSPFILSFLLSLGTTWLPTSTFSTIIYIRLHILIYLQETNFRMCCTFCKFIKTLTISIVTITGRNIIVNYKN